MTGIVDRLAELGRANQPAQFTVLAKLADLFAASPAVTSLAVRGSIAAGTSDRLSDVDLIIGIQDAHYPAVTEAHHSLIGAACCQVLPGWADTIVPDFGGLGWVHLIQHGGALCQVDLYLIPASRVPSIPGRIRREVIYTTRSPAPDPGDSAGAASYVARTRSVVPGPVDRITEALILAAMIRKRIARGQSFMAYKEAFQMTAAVQELIRAGLDPDSAYLSWYHLEEMIGATPIGRSCLSVLAEMTELPAIPTRMTLPARVDLALQAASLAAPDAVRTLQSGIETFRYLTGIQPASSGT